MAAPPVKSQPLHNFPLSYLRWARKKSSSAAPGPVPRRCGSPDQGGLRCPDPESDHDDPVQNLTDDSDSKGTVPAVPAAAAVEEKEEDEEAKPWNLRPRKELAGVILASRKEMGCAEKNDKKNTVSCSGLKSQRLRGMAEGAHNGGGEKEGKRKIWISLSKEEIEEDIYAFTGGKPSRRPKKWPRNVQKQLDNVFPGMYLVGVSADSYRVMMS